MYSIADLARHSTLAAVDARALLRAALGVDDAFLIAHANDAVSPAQCEQFRTLAARRVAGEPVAYLVGEREFFGRPFAVSPAVLIPRPETELLVELGLERLPATHVSHVLDLGTGSGCIAISIALERARARVTALDVSDAALTVARCNAQRLKAGNVTFCIGNWFEALYDLGPTNFDVIVANPPYIAEGDAHLAQGDLRFEPGIALTGAADGLGCIRLIVQQAVDYLLPSGWLLLEHGYDQAATCRALLNSAGFTQVQSWRDLAGIERVSGGLHTGV